MSTDEVVIQNTPPVHDGRGEKDRLLILSNVKAIRLTMDENVEPTTYLKRNLKAFMTASTNVNVKAIRSTLDENVEPTTYYVLHNLGALHDQEN